VVELPTELGARGPFARAESNHHKQDHNDPAANLCAGTKPRFQFGAHRNTPIALPTMRVRKVAKILRVDIAVLDVFLFARATDNCGVLLVDHHARISDGVI
jgi:hypothetical protein